MERILEQTTHNTFTFSIASTFNFKSLSLHFVFTFGVFCYLTIFLVRSEIRSQDLCF